MNRARRASATIAAAAALAAIPSVAAAQPVSQCVEPGTEPVVYVCVGHDPQLGTQVLWRIGDTKYSLWHDGDGVHFCTTGSSSSCPIP